MLVETDGLVEGVAEMEALDDRVGDDDGLREELRELLTDNVGEAEWDELSEADNESEAEPELDSVSDTLTLAETDELWDRVREEVRVTEEDAVFDLEKEIVLEAQAQQPSN